MLAIANKGIALMKNHKAENKMSVSKVMQGKMIEDCTYHSESYHLLLTVI